MRILWISSIAWKEESYKYPVDGPGAVSGSLFQQQMIEGLRNNGVEVDVIADYPYAKRINRKGWIDNNCRGSKHIVIPSSDSYVIEKLWKSKWICNTVDAQINIKHYDFAIAYLIHTPYMQALKFAKSKGIKTILVCPDLPDMMDMSLNKKHLKKYLKKIDMKVQRTLYKYIDGFVLFTKYMGERIPINDKPFTVIEGVASLDSLDVSDVPKEPVIMHAGTLHRNIGIENIIEAMKYVKNPNIKLLIFGDGELREYIKDAAEKDSRILYMGFVDRNELFEYQKKAVALINARNPKDCYTRYSFPSKTFEYLYSGSYFISTKLKGIPEEYDEFITYLNNDSPKEIADAIDRVLAENLENIKKDKVREFLVSEKCANSQVKRIIELMKKI